MKTLEQLQAAAGELWPDIDAHLSHLRDHIETLVREEGTNQAAAVEAAKLAIQTNLDALVAAAESAFAPLVAVIDPELSAPLGAVIEQAKGYTTAARRAKIEADLAAAQAAAAAHAAALAALT